MDIIEKVITIDLICRGQIEAVVHTCQHGDEPSGYVTDGEMEHSFIKICKEQNILQCIITIYNATGLLT
jgi:hypothetical protein